MTQFLNVFFFPTVWICLSRCTHFCDWFKVQENLLSFPYASLHLLQRLSHGLLQLACSFSQHFMIKLFESPLLTISILKNNESTEEH